MIISRLVLLLLLLPMFLLCQIAVGQQQHFLSVRNSMFSSSTAGGGGGTSAMAGGGAVAQLLTNSPEAHNLYGHFSMPEAGGGGGMQQKGLRSDNWPDADQKSRAALLPASTPITRGESGARHFAVDATKSAGGHHSVEAYAERKPPIPASTPIVKEPAWLRSGKFQGDIDGVDEHLLRQLQDPTIQFNALRNRQLIWPRGVIPYELDLAFSLPGALALSEARLLQRVFRTYRRRTFGCIRFRPRRSGEADYLNIVKGIGCYSQVGKTGGKQELSLGRGCLFNETITHELMHSLGFWHEHSRADRDEHIMIRWANILPGMDSQFDIVSSAIQDTLGEPYDYRSIMHYGSSAFSRNGRNTLEAFTNIIGTVMELSEMDVAKIMKLYRCRRHESAKGDGDSLPSSTGSRSNIVPWRKRKTLSERHLSDNHNQSPPSSSSSSSSSTRRPPMPFVDVDDEDGGGADTAVPTGNEDTEFGVPRIFSTTTRRPTTTAVEEEDESDEDQSTQSSLASSAGRRRRGGGHCRDHFLDCPQFRDYCKRISFYFIMRSYCPHTCGRCSSGGAAPAARTRVRAAVEERTVEEDDDENHENGEEEQGERHSKRKRR